jgi:large-conductance mechanosensitive channel
MLTPLILTKQSGTDHGFLNVNCSRQDEDVAEYKSFINFAIVIVLVAAMLYLLPKSPSRKRGWTI